EPLVPLLAHAIDAVVARTPLLEERSQHLGGILQVRVEHGNECPARDVETGPERRLVAVVSGERYHLPAWILLVDAAHDLPAAVLRAVVDEDHLVVDVPSARLGAQPLVEDGKRGRLVVAGNDNCEPGLGGPRTRHLRALCLQGGGTIRNGRGALTGALHRRVISSQYRWRPCGMRRRAT